MEVTVVDPAIPEVRLVRVEKYGDHRGFFSETYNQKVFADAGIHAEFVQDNHSLSADQGTVRGLHFQVGPFAQDKLIRVVRGAVFDVAVDIRRGSPTYGRYAAAVLSAAAWNQLYVPVGFAHGFCTVEPGTEVLYKVSALYSREHERGLLWNDPDLAIPWPVEAGAAVLSEKDRANPRLRDLPAHFTY